MSKEPHIAVIGVLPNRYVAELVVADLNRAGFMMTDISVLLADNGGTRDVAFVQGTKTAEGAVTGGTVGGTVGGVLGTLAGIGVLAIPGVGPFIAAGPIMAALSGIAVGAAAGTITGSLIGFGIPEIQAKAFEGKLRDGSALVSVHVDDQGRLEAARKIFRHHGTDQVTWTGESSVPESRAVTQPNLPRA